MDSDLIPLEEALKKIRSAVSPIDQVETIAVLKGIGRVCAKDLLSKLDQPPFDRSMVDGYALGASDRSSYICVQPVYAGDIPNFVLAPDQAAPIMTGAMLPQGTDVIVMQEDSELLGTELRLKPSASLGHRANKGRDLKIGDLLLPKGSLLAPFDLGTLVAGSYDWLEVLRPIHIWLSASGNELCPSSLLETAENPEAFEAFGKIRDVTSPMLYARLDAMPSCKTEYQGILTDDQTAELALLDRFEHSDADLLLITGGAGQGAKDFVLSSLQKRAWNILFSRVAIQPGKPSICAHKGNKFVFGLPGNPVSSIMSFELLVREVLAGFLGISFQPVLCQGILSEDYTRKDVLRLAFIPVLIRSQDSNGVLFCEPTQYKGSSHVGGFSSSRWVMLVPPGCSKLQKGETVTLRQIWYQG